MKATRVPEITVPFSKSIAYTLLITLFVCFAVPVSMAGKPSGKGGGKGGGDDGGGDPVDTPPVTYSIQWLTPPAGMSYRILDINDNGWTSGQMITDEVPYAAVVFMPDGTPIDLNAFAPLPSEDGYYMRGGYRISNNGVVVGQAYNPLTDQYRNYRYIPAGLRDAAPVSEVLPDTGSRNPKVNNFGDVACLIPDTETVRVYFLDSTIEPWVPEVQGVRAISGFNDQFQLLYLGPWAADGNAVLYKYTPGAEQQSFYLHTVARMNNYGTIVAQAWATNLRSSNHVSYSDEGEATVILEKADGYPTGINDGGEIIGWAGQRNLSNYVYFPSNGLWDVNDLVADGGGTKWQSAEIALEAINNNGQIAGTADVVSDNGEIVSEGFILTPVAP